MNAITSRNWVPMAFDHFRFLVVDHQFSVVEMRFDTGSVWAGMISFVLDGKFGIGISGDSRDCLYPQITPHVTAEHLQSRLGIRRSLFLHEVAGYLRPSNANALSQRIETGNFPLEQDEARHLFSRWSATLQQTCQPLLNGTFQDWKAVIQRSDQVTPDLASAIRDVRIP